MKKIVNIITIHKEPNYGAVLQAFALYKTIERLGGNPHIINLSMDYRRRPYSWKNRILTVLKNWVRGYYFCYKKAEKFIYKHCPQQIGDFHTVNELKNHPWKPQEYYLVGSDQVWNPEITGSLSSAYTLSFLGDKFPNKYAYASSFGNIKDEQLRATQLDINSLRGFKQVATREDLGVRFLTKLGIPAIKTIDPTLLIEDYSFLIKRPIVPNDQILFLSLSDTLAMNNFVHEVSQKLNQPVRKFYGYLQPQRSKNLQFLDVEEWLAQIASASLVITDSFHATVFSILFNRPFFVYISEPSKIYRISDLLDNLGIHGRIIHSASEIENTPPIDYELVKKKLSTYRSQSLEYLNSIISAQ